MKKYTIPVMLFSALLISGCGNKESSAPSPATNPILDESITNNVVPLEVITMNGVTFTSTRSVELENNFANIIQVQKKLNAFIISAKFDSAVKSEYLLQCSKLIAAENITQTEIIAAGDIEKQVEIVLEENELRTDVNCQVLSGSEEISSSHFVFTKSLLIDDSVKLKSLVILESKKGLELDRLIFTAQGSLVTDGEDLLLNANEIHSQSGKIETFGHNQSIKNSGKSGGNIFIKSKKSFGSLEVQLRGVDGAPQLDIPKTKSYPGAMVDSSRNAVADYRGDIECPDSNGPGGRRCPPPKLVKGKAAIAGSKGIKGDEGFPGFNGGNTGSIKYVTEEADENFSLILKLSVGKGSVGGQGGEGSFGSKGGQGSGSYGAAADGEKGESGGQGKSGLDGSIFISCFEISKSNFNKCSATDGELKNEKL